MLAPFHYDKQILPSFSTKFYFIINTRLFSAYRHMLSQLGQQEQGIASLTKLTWLCEVILKTSRRNKIMLAKAAVIMLVTIDTILGSSCDLMVSKTHALMIP